MQRRLGETDEEFRMRISRAILDEMYRAFEEMTSHFEAAGWLFDYRGDESDEDIFMDFSGAESVSSEKPKEFYQSIFTNEWI